MNRLTEKAQDALRQAQTLAQRHGQQQIELEHLAVALLAQDGGIAGRVVEKAGASTSALVQRLQQAMERAGGSAGNKGHEAATAAIGAADAIAQLRASHASH